MQPSFKNAIASFAALVTISACSTYGQDPSQWMMENKSQLENKPLSQVLIPGTHYANAYDITSKNLTICKGELESSSMTNNAKFAIFAGQNNDVISQDSLLSYLNTQDSDIYEQLEHGIRYLQLQICYQDNNFYTSNYYLSDRLDSITQQIKLFTTKNSKEIIIVDLDNNIRDESGLISSQNADKLYLALHNSLKNVLIPTTESKELTFDQIWNNKGRVLLMSSNPELIKHNDIWNRNTIVYTNNQAPAWASIKNITAAQLNITRVKDSTDKKLSTISIYSQFNPDKNSIEEFNHVIDQNLILSYLYLLPESSPLNIVIGDKFYNNSLVNFAIQPYIKNKTK